MRRPISTGLLTLAVVAPAACAHVEAPSGGPEDRTPPQLVTTRPDSFSVAARWSGDVVFAFNERISEQQVEQAVMVSPRTSPVAVDKGRDEIHVALRRGWQPGLIYHVTILPLVQDLFGNRLRAPLELVFSTGPEIPRNGVGGTVVDRITLEPDTAVRVEAIHRADSLVYATVPDSTGRFEIRSIPPGAYLVRAYRDLNRNRERDPSEVGDTAAAVAPPAGDSTRVALSVVAPDSTPPKAASAERSAPADSTAGPRIEVRFDDYLDPTQRLDSTTVEITGPAGRVPIRSVALSAPAGARPAGARDAAAARDTAARDTAAPPRLPSRSLIVELPPGTQLVPEAKYRIVAHGIRNVVGLTADAEVELTVPAAPPAGAGGEPDEPRAPDPNPNAH